MLSTTTLLGSCGGGTDGGTADAAHSERRAAIAGLGVAAAGVATILSVKVSDPGPPPAPVLPGPTGTDPPVVFNATSSARAGDVVSLQGHNFGAAPRVLLDGGDGSPLEIVNRDGAHWLAVQIPPSATGAISVRVANATGTSAPVRLNAARPLHLDATQLHPGGAFRVVGRNLLVPGSTPRVRIDGKLAKVDLQRSDEHMLSATAPASVRNSAAAAVQVDNGNGSGFVALEQRVPMRSAGSGDPFGLGVGWAAAFSVISGRTIDAATDSRLPMKVVCDGQQDVTAALQSALDLAAATGGAVVRLPAGNCALRGSVTLRSRVVLEGAGLGATDLVYASNYALAGNAIDLAGVRRLTLTNGGDVGEAPLLKDSTRVFLQQVRVRLGTSRQMYLSGNRDVVIAGCTFEQGGSISQQGPYVLNGSAGLVFDGNTTRFVDGAPAFGQVHDSVLSNNRFTRDATPQHAPGGTVHSMTLDFAYRIAVVGNTFDVANGPITNTARNDGETILTEGGGAARTENLGSVVSATAMTISDPQNPLQVDPFGTGAVPANYGVAIVGGTGAGQTRRVVAHAAGTTTVDRPWDVRPDTTSRYASFVWGLSEALIKGNTLLQNPRGIWLYHTAVRDVEIVDNVISEGGGIYLRSYQNLATRSFMPVWNVRVARNRIANSNGRWMSYVNSVFVNVDARAFGIATLGIELRDNELVANTPNATSQLQEYANVEGLMAMMRVESYTGYESSPVPRLMGTIVSGNRCTRCAIGFRTGTGAGGTTLLGSQLLGADTAWEDWATAASPERSVNTVIR